MSGGSLSPGCSVATATPGLSNLGRLRQPGRPGRRPRVRHGRCLLQLHQRQVGVVRQLLQAHLPRVTGRPRLFLDRHVPLPLPDCIPPIRQPINYLGTLLLQLSLFLYCNATTSRSVPQRPSMTTQVSWPDAFDCRRVSLTRTQLNALNASIDSAFLRKVQL